jgi:hypothetical protein
VNMKANVSSACSGLAVMVMSVVIVVGGDG